MQISAQQRTAAHGGCLVKHPDTGVISVNWEDGSGADFATIQELNDYLDGQMATVTVDTIKAIQLVNCLARDPLLDSPELWDGKKITFNPEAAAFSGILTQV